jgi:hypothetical protein
MGPITPILITSADQAGKPILATRQTAAKKLHPTFLFFMVSASFQTCIRVDLFENA